MRLVIDAGHGGSNTGCEHSGIVEKTFTLQLAAALYHCLEPLGAAVFMTRQSDTDVSLEERGALSAKIQPHLVVSLHLDGSPDPSVGFLSCYAMPDDNIGRSVGEEIERAAPNILRPRTPETTLVRPTDWTVRAYNVLHHHAPAPAVLVECAFTSNPRHAAFIATQHGRQALIAILMLGIARRYELSGETANA